MQNYIFIFLITMCGAFVQRVSGFGFGIVAMFVLPYCAPSYGEATSLSGLSSMPFTWAVAIKRIKKINWKIVIYPIISSTILKFSCTPILTHVGDTSVFKRALGAFFIVLSLYFIFFAKKIKIKPSVGAGLFCGVFSGILDAFFAMGGPPMVIYYTAATGDDKEEYLSSIQAYFAISGLISLIVRAVNGLVTADVLMLWPIGLLGAAIGHFAGMKLFRHIKPDLLKKIIYGIMIVFGLISLIKG